MTESTNVETDTPTEVPIVDTPAQNSTFVDFNKPLDEQQDTVRSRIDADYRKNKELERQLKDNARKIRDLEDQALELQKPSVVAPPKPEEVYDLGDEEFSNRINQAVESRTNLANWESQQKMRQQELQAQAEREQEESLNNFVSKAVKSGKDHQQVIMAGSVVGSAVNPEIANYIMNLEHGPDVLLALANNPMELQSLVSLDNIQAGVKLNDMAKSYQKNVISNTPPPDEPIAGNGVSTDSYNRFGLGSFE